MFRRWQKQEGKEPEFSNKSNVECKIGEIQGKRGEETMEALKEEQEEAKKKYYRIEVFFAGGGAPGGPGNRDIEISEASREIMASGMMQLTEAEDFALTNTGVKLIFRERLKNERAAIIFGKEKMSKIEGSDYKSSIGRETVRGTGPNSGIREDKIEAIAYD